MGPEVIVNSKLSKPQKDSHRRMQQTLNYFHLICKRVEVSNFPAQNSEVISICALTKPGILIKNSPRDARN